MVSLFNYIYKKYQFRMTDIDFFARLPIVIVTTLFLVIFCCIIFKLIMVIRRSFSFYPKDRKKVNQKINANVNLWLLTKTNNRLYHFTLRWWLSRKCDQLFLCKFDFCFCTCSKRRNSVADYAFFTLKKNLKILYVSCYRNCCFGLLFSQTYIANVPLELTM